MFAVQSTVRRAPKLMSLVKAQQRTVVSAPPSNRVSLGEKLALGAVLYVGMMATPMYIATNFKKYRGDS